MNKTLDIANSIGRAGEMANTQATNLKRKYVLPLSVKEVRSDPEIRRPLGRTETVTYLNSNILDLPEQLGEAATQARIHTGPGASEAARNLDADAFTMGRDVYFAQQRFDPHSSEGLGLLAHELTHVKQQMTPHGPDMKLARRQAVAGSRARAGTGGSASPLNQDQEAESPAAEFDSPQQSPPSEGPPAPSTTSTEDRGAAAKQAEASPSGADPRAVADKVYELMRQEAELARLRGVYGRKW